MSQAKYAVKDKVVITLHILTLVRINGYGWLLLTTATTGCRWTVSSVALKFLGSLNISLLEIKSTNFSTKKPDFGHRDVQFQNEQIECYFAIARLIGIQLGTVANIK